jgi:hypothetical protein
MSRPSTAWRSSGLRLFSSRTKAAARFSGGAQSAPDGVVLALAQVVADVTAADLLQAREVHLLHPRGVDEAP